MLMGKIIKFPGDRADPVKQEDDDFYYNELSKVYIEDIIDRVGHQLVSEFHQLGYDVDSEEFVLRFMYSLEVMKSSLYNCKGFEHPLSTSVGEQSQRYFQQQANEDE